eukprot:Skav213116  [mRNA]  locus=scaffold107:42137:49620:+ [translate_table: standard]
MPWVWADGFQLSTSTGFGDPWTRDSSVSETDSAADSKLRHNKLPVPNPAGYSSYALCPCLDTVRFGEADHPGPELDFDMPPIPTNMVRIGCSNPGGLRGKEAVALSPGSGIWSYSETHLTHATQTSVAAVLRHSGSSLNRSVRLLTGAPVPLRSNSDTAGSWAGVAVQTDFPARELALPWQNGERSSGRVMVTRRLVHEVPFVISTCYGFAPGPTWPNNKALTTKLLQSLTKDVVIGGAGPRVIAGDMNAEVSSLDEFQVWQRYGWVEAQHMALDRWERPIDKTCREATVIDHVWLSPEAAALCSSVGTVNKFVGHRTVFADFAVPERLSPIQTWPRPSSIDWTQVDLSAWHQCFDTLAAPSFDGDSTRFFQDWAQHWETSLDGHCPGHPNKHLPSNQRGRAVRTEPMWTSPTPPVAKPSREGEVALRSDLVSTQTQLWFKQLRRLQSYQHAILADKQTTNAVAYRLCLWDAIKCSRGFAGRFEAWWHVRRRKLPGSPVNLPLGPPDGPTASQIFLDFKCNFEALERWCLRQRGSLLQAKYDQSCKRLFHDLRPTTRDQLDLLWNSSEHQVLDFDLESGQLHVDPAPAPSHCSTWTLHGQHLELLGLDGEVLSFRQLPSGLEVGDVLQLTSFLTSADAIHEEMLRLWKPRWQRASQLGTSDWTRIAGFVCLQQGIELSGFSTDIEKCFNNVSRESLLMLAGKGLPEGCAMSVVGMVLVDWALHVYLSALCPSVHAFSYVDNVSEAGHVVMDVVSAFFSTICFFQLWGLTLDLGKTYFWSTDGSSRKLLATLGLSLRHEALELGGTMNFGSVRRNHLLKQRGRALESKWARLKRSTSPLRQKFQVLPLAFWAAALHGAPSCPLAANYLHDLRQAANRSLRCNQAGSNALLRFSLKFFSLYPGSHFVIKLLDTMKCPNFGVMKPYLGVKSVRAYAPVWTKKPDVGPLNMRLVECNEHCQSVLAARMDDGFLDRAPVIPDITTWEPSEEVASEAEGLAGGFPCQGVCGAGKMGGLADQRTGLVKRIYRVLDRCPKVMGCGHSGFPEYEWLNEDPALDESAVTISGDLAPAAAAAAETISKSAADSNA